MKISQDLSDCIAPLPWEYALRLQSTMHMHLNKNFTHIKVTNTCFYRIRRHWSTSKFHECMRRFAVVVKIKEIPKYPSKSMTLTKFLFMYRKSTPFAIIHYHLVWAPCIYLWEDPSNKKTYIRVHTYMNHKHNTLLFWGRQCLYVSKNQKRHICIYHHRHL